MFVKYTLALSNLNRGNCKYNCKQKTEKKIKLDLETLIFVLSTLNCMNTDTRDNDAFLRLLPLSSHM